MNPLRDSLRSLLTVSVNYLSVSRHARRAQAALALLSISYAATAALCKS